jgi:hypothetical protein
VQSLHPINILASGADFAGIIFVVIYLVVAALSKRLKKDGDAPTSAKSFQNIPSRPASTQSQPSKPTGSPDLAGEMRRFLEEMQQRSKPTAPPLQKTSSSQYVRPPQKQIQSKPQKPKPVVFVEEKKSQSLVDIAKELEAADQTLIQEITELPRFEFSPQIVETNSAANLFDRNLSKTPAALKQAIMMMEILGKPRSLNPYC